MSDYLWSKVAWLGILCLVAFVYGFLNRVITGRGLEEPEPHETQGPQGRS